MAQHLAVVAPSPVVTPLVDIAIPVYNEEHDLERSVRRLRRYLDHRFPFEARITVVDNASTDATWAIAQRLALELDGVRATRLKEKGRAAPYGTRGSRVTRRSSPTWTSICLPTWTPYYRWSRRSSPGTAT